MVSWTMEKKILHSPMQGLRPEQASGFGAGLEHPSMSKSLHYIWLNISQGSLFQSGKSDGTNSNPAGEELRVGNLWEAAENCSPAVAVAERGTTSFAKSKPLVAELQAATPQQY